MSRPSSSWAVLKISVWVALVVGLTFAFFRSEVQDIYGSIAVYQGLGDTGLYPFAFLILAIPMLQWSRPGLWGPLSAIRVRLLSAAGVLCLILIGRFAAVPYPSSLILVLLVVVFAANMVWPRLIGFAPIIALYAFATEVVYVASSAITAPVLMPYTNFVNVLMNTLGFHSVASGYGIVMQGSNGLIVFGIDGACLGIAATTIYIMLLALLVGKISFTLRGFVIASVVGLGIIQLLNLARILTLVAVGATFGASAFLQTHDWLGYALFGSFYLFVVIMATRGSVFGQGRWKD